ncbi:hypothetical protein DSM107133_01620 [Pseudosulfitobacter sp. DSM 107133]|nr:hypothetical protein DSM107133_01620 [Pseudosulfitobacter sp. DSM 107133]
MTAIGFSPPDPVQCVATMLLSDVGTVATWGDPIARHIGVARQCPGDAARAIAKFLLNGR